MPNEINILLIDDHVIVREGLAVLLNQHGLGRIESAGSAEEAMAAIQRRPPEVVVLDISLGHQSGLELLKTIHLGYPAIRVVVLSMHEEALYAERCLRAGAMGYIMKSVGHQLIIQCIRQVMEGKTFVSEAVRDRMWQQAVNRPKDVGAPPEERLTDRELEVYRLIGEGLSTQQIADSLKVSAKTIQTYRNFIKEKLVIENATELVHRASLWAKGRHPA
jgi:DNA-binding NarL/FixJ family response regulator